MKNTDYRTSQIFKGLAKRHWRLAKLIGPLPIAKPVRKGGEHETEN